MNDKEDIKLIVDIPSPSRNNIAVNPQSLPQLRFKMLYDELWKKIKHLQLLSFESMQKKGEVNLIDYQNNRGYGLLKNEQNPGSMYKEQVRFRKYQDEPLNPRISNVKMKTDTPNSTLGRLHLTIDGKECVFAINGDTFQGWKTGAVPTNLLANICLRQFDNE